MSAKKTALIVNPKTNATIVARELDNDPALRDYLASLRQYKTLTRDEEQTLGRLARSEHAVTRQQAKKKLIEHNLRLVVTISKRFVGQGLPMLDLIQEGTLGLMEAVERYEPRDNVRFCSYAGWWIHQAMHRALVNTGSLVRLPNYIVTLRVKAHRFQQKFEAEHGRLPSEAELRLATGATAAALHDALDTPPALVSLDTVLTASADDGSLTVADTVPDTSEPDLDTLLCARETYHDLYAAMRATLSPDEIICLAYRFGLGGLGRNAAGEADDAAMGAMLKQPPSEQGYPQSESVKQKAIKQQSGVSLEQNPASGIPSEKSAKQKGQSRSTAAKLSTGGLMQYEAIATRMDSTADKVRRLEANALKKLRDAYGVTELTRLMTLLVA